MTGLRRRPILVTLGAVALLAGVGLLAAGWYLIGEAERTGRLVSAALSRAAGVAVSVERARIEGPSRLVLYNLHLPPGPRWTGDVRARELRLEGGLLPILFPRGRALEIVLVSTSVTLAEHAAPLEPPSAESLESLRRLVMRVIEWPAVLSLRIEGGELREGDQVVTFDLTGERTPTGAIGVALRVSPPGGPPALSLRLAGSATNGQVSLRIDARGEPARLGAFWPAALPALAQVALQAEGRLKAGGQLELAGLARAERATGGPPFSIEFASEYHAAAARLELSRLGLNWGDGLRLRGSGAVELGGDGTRVALDLAGPAAGSPVALALRYTAATGAVTARLDAEGIDARRLFATAGLAPPPADVTARRLRLSLTGNILSGQERVAVDASFEDLGLRELGADTRADGQLRGDATLRPGASGLELGRLGPTTLTLTRGGGVLLALTAGSRGEAPWPLAVEAAAADLGRLPTPSSLPATLTGRAEVRGELDRGRFAGVLTAELPRIELRLTSPIVVTGVRATIPLAWGAPSPATAGTPGPRLHRGRRRRERGTAPHPHRRRSHRPRRGDPGLRPDRRPPDGPGALSLRPRALGGSRAHRRRPGQLRGGRRRGRDRSAREAAELREGAGGVDGPASKDARNPPGLQVFLARRGGPGGPGRGAREPLARGPEAARCLSAAGQGHQLQQRAARTARAHVRPQGDRMRASLRTKAAVLGVLLHGCLSVTVNVAFPQEKLEGAAASIEDMVGSGPPAAPAPAAPARKPEGQAPAPARGRLVWFQPAVVEAQEVPELRTRTPEVMAAIESRRKRRPELDAAARTGCLGENKDGLVDARPGQSCPPTLGQLVAAENADRMFLYKTL
ncbi:MAG: hypothetical protein DME06_12595, partial [Candidatus Rokuibacteriota bacterium]